MSLFSSSLKRLTLLAAALAPVALITGCANMVGTASESNSLTPAATISGNLHGGNQPISGATVTLWGAGANGYGSISTQYAQTTSSTDGAGSFQFIQDTVGTDGSTGIIPGGSTPEYSCPTTGDPQMYIIAKGGSTQGPTSPVNNDAAFIIALGKCSTAGSLYVTLNEVTTVATLAALQQYFNPSIESLGYNNTTQSALGFANAVATIPTLVATNSGVANTSFTPSSSYAGVVMTATPEYAKINTIANVLASCINSDPGSSTNCSTLFAAATQPSPSVTSQPGTTANPNTFPTTIDTLQAAYFMLINPTDSGALVSNCTGQTSNLVCLFNLSTGVGAPFVGLSSAPTDWTIGIGYANTTRFTSTGTPYLFDDPLEVAVDGSGNIWVLSDDASTVNVNNSITELSPTGGVENWIFSGSLGAPAGLTIDPSNNVWIANAGTSAAPGSTVLEYTVGGTTKTFTTKVGPKALSSDGAGNIFVLEPLFGAGGQAGDLEEIPAKSATGTTATTIATGLVTDFSNLAIDGNDTIWITGGGLAGATNGTDAVYQFLYNTTTSSYPSTPNTTTTAGGITAPESAIAIDNSNNVWINNYGATTPAGIPSLSAIAATKTSTISGLKNSPFSVDGSLTTTDFSVMDGASNLWFTSKGASTTGFVLEYSNAGAPLSPLTGYSHAYNYTNGIAVDPSGNVWIANDDSYGGNSTAAKPIITEIVGAAVPVVTPIAAGLPTTIGGASLLGATP